jgi:hypothetical protein
MRRVECPIDHRPALHRSRNWRKLAADLPVLQAQDDSDLSGLQRQKRLTLFNAELSQGCSVAESGWGVADPPYTSEAESEREHTACASLSSETDSSYSFLGSARTGGTLGYHRDTNR